MDTTQTSIHQLEDQAYNLAGVSVPNVVISSGGSSGLGAIYPNTVSSVFGATVDWNPVTGRRIKLDGPDADIEINGQSLVATLQGIQDRLNILRPNEKLEAVIGVRSSSSFSVKV